MAIMNDVKEGLEILIKYEKIYGIKGYVSAEHDQIWAGCDYDTDRGRMDKKDRARLRRLGWFVDTDCDCWSRFV